MAINRPPSLGVGAKVNDRYTVLNVVGQGGLGTVYQVRDELFGSSNTYALKETFDLSEGAREQFEREARWLERLDHPNIPRVRQYFQGHDRLYLVMDFISGENLEHKLLRGKSRPLAEAEVLRWTQPICDALAYLHSQKPPIIHRDVKPANIIVTANGHPALVDLGIAKEHMPGMPNMTATFIRKSGTEGYAPPEQYASNGTTGPWSDIYSMGATMYHLLTGQVPASAVERAALDNQLIAPRKLNPQLTVATEAIIMRALAIRPADRFASMREMWAALGDALKKAPVDLPAEAVSATTSKPLCSRCGRPMAGPAPVCAACAAEIAMRSGPFGGSNATGPTMRRSVAPLPAPTPTPQSMAVSGIQPLSGLADKGGRRLGRAIDRPRFQQQQPADSLPRTTTSTNLSSQPRPAMHQRVATRTSLMDDELAPRRVPWRLISGLLAVVLVAGGIVLGTHIFSFGAPDESSPRVTVNGYFTALKAHDFQRAYLYLSPKGTTTQSLDQFTNTQESDLHDLGDITTFQVQQISDEGANTQQVTVQVTRAGRDVSAQYSVTVEAINGNWQIDSINNG